MIRGPLTIAGLAMLGLTGAVPADLRWGFENAQAARAEAAYVHSIQRADRDWRAALQKARTDLAEELMRILLGWRSSVHSPTDRA